MGHCMAIITLQNSIRSSKDRTLTDATTQYPSLTHVATDMTEPPSKLWLTMKDIRHAYTRKLNSMSFVSLLTLVYLDSQYYDTYSFNIIPFN